MKWWLGQTKTGKWLIHQSLLLMLRNSPEITDFRNSPPEVFWKYAANLQENTQCGSVISIKLQNNFIEITLRYECSPVNLLNIFRTPFPRKTYGGLPLRFVGIYAEIT